jgi:hypothetical protein
MGGGDITQEKTSGIEPFPTKSSSPQGVQSFTDSNIPPICVFEMGRQKGFFMIFDSCFFVPLQEGYKIGYPI